MKLLTKSTLLIATLSLFLFFIMGVIFFQVLKNMSLSTLDRELSDLKEVVDDHLSESDDYQNLSLPGIDSLVVIPVERTAQTGVIFGDTVMRDVKDKQFRTFRYLRFNKAKADQYYLVTIFKSTTPTDKLVEQVTLMITLMVILFIAGIFILNRFIFGSLWKDFFEAIEKLKRFEKTKEPVILGEQDIQEFDERTSIVNRSRRKSAHSM